MEKTIKLRRILGRLRSAGAAVFVLADLICARQAVADPAITPGSADDAVQYYQKEEKLFPGLKLTNGVTPLDDVVAFLGYPLSGTNLESLDPAVLMSPQAETANGGMGLGANDSGGARFRDGDILASRFFAPKIVNINATNPTPGWRKLIRLRSRPNSPAMRSGVDSAIILFNFLVAANEQPFTNHSFNTQVMLLAPSLSDRVYWLDFDGTQHLTLALNASFDAADLKHLGNHDYFVPDGCNACHGSPGNFRPPMVNYLDTDHWFDRIEDDFASLKQAGTPLLFDAKTNDPTQPTFVAAFDVIRRFNEEALRENNLVHSDSFEAEAARTWLRLHQNSEAHFPPVARGFSTNGAPTWQASEADGLKRLNRYCFRCHGSVYFSVYDREKVLSLAGDMKARIKPNPNQLKRAGFKMPPDRDNLAPEEVQAIYDFLENLK
jgi:mono/diheme cytochrome c family protein